MLLGLLVAGLAWEGSVVLFGIRPAYLPRLSAILAAIAATPGAYWDGFLRTLEETLIGFAAGAAVGVANGVAFFRWPVLRDMLFPIFVVSQTIPVIAFGALVVLWFGNTLLAKAVIAFYLTFFPVTVNTLLGLQSVDPAQVALLRSFGAGGGSLLLRLQLPTALPQIFVALRLGRLAQPGGRHRRRVVRRHHRAGRAAAAGDVRGERRRPLGGDPVRGGAGHAGSTRWWPGRSGGSCSGVRSSEPQRRQRPVRRRAAGGAVGRRRRAASTCPPTRCRRSATSWPRRGMNAPPCCGPAASPWPRPWPAMPSGR